VLIFTIGAGDVDRLMLPEGSEDEGCKVAELSLRSFCGMSTASETPGDAVRSGMGDGGSGNERVDGSGGMCLILKENCIDPSANREVSGNDENALEGSQRSTP
jgi:hypothetical protein